MKDLNIAEIRKLSITDFLQRLAIHPVKNTDTYALYHAPYREDRHPSFKVSKKKNRWYDFALCRSGDIIDLGQLIYDCDDISYVIRKLQECAPVVSGTRIAIREGGNTSGSFRNLKVQSLTDARLLSYIDSRSIDVTIAVKYCKEVHFTMGARRYYALGFPNVNGGYEVRNPFFKGTIASRDISLISNGSGNAYCVVFEEFMDFLSYMTLNKRADLLGIMETMDFIVLNSVSNIKKAMPWLTKYQAITCCLDNDDAGRRVVELLGEAFGGVHDASDAYKGYKDLNDFLRGKHYCP